MKLDDLVQQSGEWLKGTGPYAGIVMSSRIRLARNLHNNSFLHWEKDHGKAVYEEITPVVGDLLEKDVISKGLFVDMSNISELDRTFLLERHLVSQEFISDKEYRAVGISKDENISVMVNEEDHLRIQAIESGLSVQNTWKTISALDDKIGSQLEYAYSTNFGYLTACPTNVGTGMRGSVMLHLPGLVISKQINQILQTIVKIGLVARGFYGEGTEAIGNFYQISNQITLGYKEEEILNNLERVVKQIIDHEQNARQTLYRENKILLEDKIWRAYGLLKSSYIIASKEAIELLSSVRLGVDLGFIKDIDTKNLNELFITIQPAHLQKWAGKELSSRERDVTRAKLIREKFEVVK